MCKLINRGSGNNAPAVAHGAMPILFILDPSGIENYENKKYIDDLSNAPGSFIELWILNRIQSVIIEENKTKKLKLYRTNFEGCLTEIRKKEIKGKNIYPWAGLFRKIKNEIPKYQFFLSTISLEGFDVRDLFEKYKIPEKAGTEIENKINISRPGFENVSIDSDIFLDTLKLDCYIVKIPLETLFEKNELGKLEYWESVIFFNTAQRDVAQFRTNLSKKLPVIKSFEEIKQILTVIRGNYFIGYEAYSLIIDEEIIYPGNTTFINENDTRKEQKDKLLPFLLFDESNKIPSTSSDINYVLWESDKLMAESGPLWLESNFCNNGEAEGSKVKKSEIFESYLKIKIWQMGKNDSAKDKLPISRSDSPSVRDSTFFEKFNTHEFTVIFLSQQYSEIIIMNSIKSILNKNQYNVIIKDNFFFGYGNDWNECLIDALNKAATFWKFKYKYEFNDIFTQGKRENSLISTHVKFSFDTNTDAFSESLAPLHIFSQIKSWWDGLNKIDQFGILNCDFIEIKGFTSDIGTAEINKQLRINRAKKTAYSLYILLQSEFNKDAHKKTLRKPIFGNPDFSQIMKAKSNSEVPIIYRGESGKPDNLVITPCTSLMLNLVQDKGIIEDAINSHYKNFPDDNPEHRVVTISFHQFLPEKTEQFLKENIYLLVATPIPAYRVLLHFRSRVNRMLVYVLPPIWNNNL